MSRYYESCVGLGKFRRVWDLTTARSYANVLSPQDLRRFLQAFRGINIRPTSIHKVLEIFSTIYTIDSHLFFLIENTIRNTQ